MMKIIVFVLFCAVISVQSKITPLYTSLLIYEGKSVKLKCNDTSWSSKGDLITDCSGCPSNCKIENKFKERVEATCVNNETFLRFISTKVADEGKLKCPESGTASFLFLVGRNGPSFYPGNGKSYALNNQDYSLYCEGNTLWYNQTGDPIGNFYQCQNYEQNKYTKHFSCSYNNNKNNTILNLKKVTVEKDDGKNFGCRNSDGFFLFTLTVNVAVESVSIQAEKQSFIENEIGTIQCIVEKSKPKPSFEWRVVLKDGLTFNISNAFDKHELVNGKFWKTTSIIKLKLTRKISEIQCGARIEDMPYVYKTIKPNIFYAPEEKPIITSTPSHTRIGGKMQVTCEWKGGHPQADIELSCLSEIKTGKSIVTIEKTVSSRLDKTCICKGKHVAKNTETQKILDIQYPPDIRIDQNVTHLGQNSAAIKCLITSHPESKEYGMNQTWGNINKVHIPSKEKNFKDVSYGDLGRWTCWAKNGVGKKTEKFVDIKVNVPPRFICNRNQKAIAGSLKKIKCCFYCHPEASSVKWYNKNKEMPSDKITYVAAEDGLFPFTGNCCILEVKVESNLQDYELEVQNSVGKKAYTVSLYSDAAEKIKLHIILYIVIGISITMNLILLFVIFCLFAKIKQIKNNFINKKGEENETYEEIKAKFDKLQKAQPTNNDEIYEEIKANFDNLDKTQPTNNDETYEEINDISNYSHKVQPTNSNVSYTVKKNPQPRFPSKAKLEAKRKQNEYENLWIKPHQVESKELPYDNLEYIQQWRKNQNKKNPEFEGRRPNSKYFN